MSAPPAPGSLHLLHLLSLSDLDNAGVRRPDVGGLGLVVFWLGENLTGDHLDYNILDSSNF